MTHDEEYQGRMSLKQAAIRAERGKEYGDSAINMRALTKTIEAIVSQAMQQEVKLPPQTGALVMAACKILRQAYRAKQDNVDDAKNYLDFSGEVGRETV